MVKCFLLKAEIIHLITYKMKRTKRCIAYFLEAVARKYSVKKVFLEISQN